MKAIEDVRTLVGRLQVAINFPEEDCDEWQASLWELVKNSIHGFWNADKRLLYDLQKVCLDHERVTYKIDIVKWLVSRGQRPFRRPLTNLREVAMAKHLASAASRLVYVRLSGMDRERLTELIQNAAALSEKQMRERMRPILRKTLMDVRLSPENIPEKVAFEKLVEDSLDCIASRGYLSMGYLRDAVSKNDLKLSDLQEVRELWSGDRLLQTDDRLDIELDGVYRRGEFYLRWLQWVSAMFFGTRLGRFTTLYLIMPFGGAVLIVEGVRHVVHLFKGRDIMNRRCLPGRAWPRVSVLLSMRSPGFLAWQRHRRRVSFRRAHLRMKLCFVLLRIGRPSKTNWRSSLPRGISIS